METLTAFVRERSQRNYAEFRKADERISRLAHALWEQEGKPEGKDDAIWADAVQLGEPPATDIDAVLTVIKRRSERSRKREATNGWRLDLSQAVLKRAALMDVHLEQAVLSGAHLERAILRNAHLAGSILMRAHLERAVLSGAHLEGAILGWAHLEGTDLRGASGLSGDQLRFAYGDDATRLPKDVDRPTHWPEKESVTAEAKPRLL